MYKRQVLDWPDRVLVISQGEDATRWYYYKYELTAKVVNGYGGTWWGNIALTDDQHAVRPVQHLSLIHI